MFTYYNKEITSRVVKSRHVFNRVVFNVCEQNVVSKGENRKNLLFNLISLVLEYDTTTVD